MTRYAIRRSDGDGSSCTVELYRVPRDGESHESEQTRLLATCGPGDGGEPVITISLPDEDRPPEAVPHPSSSSAPPGC
ncbi:MULTISPECIES: hypothetical protein [unclassified Streptomyces]|uniref:hypothetical protein n=1 Tax=unclassified Streptomyces TaxID=2593676 RepID=UPI000B27FA5D|nr:MULTISPECIES: hypothetical protein [unclassified Streptomyces]